MSPAEQQLEAEKAAAQVDQGLGFEGLGFGFRSRGV